MSNYKDILKNINSPADLQSLSVDRLNKLAGALREEIITTVSKNGGHLAPNLGVVELTLALHTVFKTPRDKIIWDVGHQSYVHKLLTGRRQEFHTLRQAGGISGFPRPVESSHDCYGTGHSSTSISAALGLALARDLKGEQHSVVAVIGDGAMTGGLAFEALNHAGHLHRNLIVVLNDNEMSISHNVGALSEYLGRMRTDPKYTRGKDEVEQLLRKIPTIGPKVVRVVERLKDSMKYFLVPGMFFEELGFVYLGPVDGHNIQAVSNALKQARAGGGPVVVHVLTQKGRGYPPAEENADLFHGIGPFEIKTGEVKKSPAPPSYTEIFGSTIVELARKNPQICAITAAMSSGTGLNDFAKQYPDRFFDVGIAEQHAVTLAAGLATGGYRPVVAVYSSFLQRAYDQIIHDVCLQNLPVTFVVDRAGLVGDDGATHHGMFDCSYLRPVPNMVIMAPKDENELQHMLKTAVEHPGPCAVRFPRGNGTGCIMDEIPAPLPVGKAEVLREGRDLTILALGTAVSLALEAAKTLAGYGIHTTVVNARFVKPLDEDCIIRYAMRTAKIITVEENALAGGFGSAVLELLTDRQMYGVRVRRVGIPDHFVEHGRPDQLKAYCGLAAEHLVEQALEMLGIGHQNAFLGEMGGGTA